MITKLELQRSQGIFSAWLHGNQGPLIVCLHGFPDNYRTFDPLLEGLLSAGYRVLTPVMRGYEASSVQQANDYFVAQLAEDVIAWLDYLNVPRAFLIGHDWGAVTGWTVTAMAPERFHAYVSLAIPHLRNFLSGIRVVPSQLLYSWYMSFFQVPRVPDWLIRQQDWALLRLLWSRWSPGWTPAPAVIASVIDTFEQPGVISAALGYYRCMYRLWAAENKKVLALSAQPVKVPSLVLAGQRDGCISPDMFEHCMADVRLAGFVEDQSLPNVGHFLHQEAPSVVLEKVIGFFYRWREPESAILQ